MFNTAVFTKYRFYDVWQHHPAALYAFAAILGSCFALYSTGILFSISSFVLLTYPLFISSCQASRLRILLAVILGITCFGFTLNRYHFPDVGTTKTGTAEIEIHSVRLTKTPFGQIWKYKSTLKSFIHEGKNIAQDIPVIVSIPFDKGAQRPKANFYYRFPARLKKTSHGKHVINPIKNETWQNEGDLHNLAEWRYKAKLIVREHIEKSVRDVHTSAFLSGIATGEFEDRLLSYELGRFGLQHLMAISGLHFSILSGLLMLTLGLIFPKYLAAILTIMAMSAYFLFLGTSASVTRAWIALMIGLGSVFVQRQSSGLNTLGIGALVVILCDPLALEEIGFQFSFGITAAILLWYSHCEVFLQLLLKKRRLSEATTMDSWDQHGYCLLHFLRQGLALTLAVNLIALPLTFYHFHSFPIMGLVYNLFFPFLMSFSLIFLALGCFFSLIFPWLGSLVHRMNEAYTNFMLDFTFNLPKNFDLNLQVENFPKEALLIYLLILFFVGIGWNRSIESFPFSVDTKDTFQR